MDGNGRRKILTARLFVQKGLGMRYSSGFIFLGIFSAVLTGCGGGGGGGGSSYGEVSPTPTSTASTGATNAAPVFTALPQTISVNENQTSITTVAASDADSDPITFSISGGDAQDLSIDRETGVLVFVTAPDYESKSTYQTEVTASDSTTSTSQSITIEIVDIAETSSEAPLEINVVVSSGSNGYGGGNKYFVNGTASPDITLEAGKTYRFLQSDSSNATHPMRLSLAQDGTHSSGTQYTDNVEYVGSAGTTGAYLQFTVPAGITADTLYYYCVNHSGMGGRILITTASGSGYQVVGMN